MSWKLNKMLAFAISGTTLLALLATVFLTWLGATNISKEAYWGVVATTAGVFATLAATFTALLVGLKEEFYTWMQPLTVSLEGLELEPYLENTHTIDVHTTGAFTRLKLTNTSARHACNMRVHIDNLWMRIDVLGNPISSEDSGTWAVVRGFVPIALNWTHSTSSNLDILPPRSSRFVDLGAWVGPSQGVISTGLTLSTEVPPLSRYHVLRGLLYNMEISIISKEGAHAKSLWELRITDGRYQHRMSNDPVISLRRIKELM